jgi:hypothetical protein
MTQHRAFGLMLSALSFSLSALKINLKERSDFNNRRNEKI